MTTQTKTTWRKVKLGEVAGVLGGFAFKSEWFNTQKIGSPVIKIQNITGGLVDTASTEYIDMAKVKRDFSKFRLRKGDFLVAMTGATAGKVGLLTQDIPCYLNQRVGKFYPKNGNELDKKFLYYSVINPKNLNLLKKLADGSAQGNMSSSQIEDTLEIFFPEDINEQKRIASILSAFDDKIELNNKINKTLEEMAQAIFKHWFVDFKFPGHEKTKFVNSELGKIPEGWEVKKLSSIFSFEGGSQPPKIEHIYEEKEGYIRFIQNRDYSTDAHKTYIPISKKNKICDEFDILMDKYGEVGTVRFGIAGAYNVALAKIKPKNEYSREFLRWYFSQNSIKNMIEGSAVASTRGSLNQNTFTGIKIVEPPDFLLKKFEKLSRSFIDKILQNKKENQKLAELRDLLLPKLMSGEIRV